MGEILTSTCRHCGERVIFTRLQNIPEGHPKYNAERPYNNIRRYEIWHHRNAPIGEELHCANQPEKTEDGRHLYRKRAEPRDYCVQSVDSAYSSRYCNRRVKDAEIYMCGIHARREREHERKRQKDKEQNDLSNYVFSETVKLQEELKKRFGLDTLTHYDWKSHAYTGRVIVNPRELLDFLEAYLPEEESF